MADNNQSSQIQDPHVQVVQDSQDMQESQDFQDSQDQDSQGPSVRRDAKGRRLDAEGRIYREDVNDEEVDAIASSSQVRTQSVLVPKPKCCYALNLDEENEQKTDDEDAASVGPDLVQGAIDEVVQKGKGKGSKRKLLDADLLNGAQDESEVRLVWNNDFCQDY